jgi:hypothetical protein
MGENYYQPAQYNKIEQLAGIEKEDQCLYYLPAVIVARSCRVIPE